MRNQTEGLDKRLARRFPLELPVEVDASDVHTKTQDISAGGVKFQVDTELEVGATLEFTVAMPAESLGTPADVMVKCVGRVVRCEQEGQRREVAVLIDDYSFERP